MSRDFYLFTHFIGESEHGEQIYFSLSEDGLHWNDLNNGQPVLVSDIGEKGVRDPFLIRDEKNGILRSFKTRAYRDRANMLWLGSYET